MSCQLTTLEVRINGTYAAGWVVETLVETLRKFAQIFGDGGFLIPGASELVIWRNVMSA